MTGPLPEHPRIHLDRGYDSRQTRDLLEMLDGDRDIAVKASPPRSRPASAGPSSARARG